MMELQQRIWKPTWSDQRNDLNDEDEDGFVKSSLEQTIGFSVKNAVLFPPEVEKGRWPENYSLSDHARLTVVFSPIRMPCSRLSWLTSHAMQFEFEATLAYRANSLEAT